MVRLIFNFMFSGALLLLSSDFAVEKVFFTDQRLYSFSISNEDGNVWQLYMLNERFEDSLMSCTTAEQRDYVRISYNFGFFLTLCLDL